MTGLLFPVLHDHAEGIEQGLFSQWVQGVFKAPEMHQPVLLV